MSKPGDDGSSMGGDPPRDEKGRWTEGNSGNPAGRPIKAERSHIPQQWWRDVIRQAEKSRTFKLGDREVQMPTVLAILENAIQKSLRGNGPSQRHFFEMYSAALEANEKEHPEEARALKEMEKDLKKVGKTFPDLDKANIRTINKRRKGTQDTGEIE